jgi:hypothetical protein
VNLIERVTHRQPNPPPSNRERRAQWAYRYYLLPVDYTDNQDPDNFDCTDPEAPQ